MTALIEYLKAELVRRSWRPADLARAAGVPDATISHVLNGSRRAGPDVCNAIARALDESPERIFRLAGLLPSLPPAVEDEREAVTILRGLSTELRAVAMRMLRSLRPGAAQVPASSGLASTSDQTRAADSTARDPYLDVLEQLWDKAPDWKKKDIAAQIRLAVEEYEREQEKWAVSRGEEGVRDARRSS